MLKITPYHVKKAQAFSVEGLAAVVNLKWKNDEELRDLALAIFICFTSMRIEDVDFAKTSNFEIKDADSENCRRIVTIVDRTKNDKNGTGPVAGRTFVLPCICMDKLSAAEKNKFARALAISPQCACIDSCPFNTVKEYLNACPRNDDSTQLAFMRALSSRGGEHRTLTLNKLGTNEVRKLVEKVNAR